jgi:hypothetical protein
LEDSGNTLQCGPPNVHVWHEHFPAHITALSPLVNNKSVNSLCQPRMNIQTTDNPIPPPPASPRQVRIDTILSPEEVLLTHMEGLEREARLLLPPWYPHFGPDDIYTYLQAPNVPSNTRQRLAILLARMLAVRGLPEDKRGLLHILSQLSKSSQRDFEQRKILSVGVCVFFLLVTLIRIRR